MPDIFVDPNDEKTPQKRAAAEAPVKESWIEQHKDQVSLLLERPGKPGIFTAFAPRPQGIAFEEQETNEEILLLIRQHLVTNVPWIAAAFIIALLPLLFLPAIRSDLFTLLPVSVSPQLFFVTLSFYYLIILGFVLNQFATWYYQIGIITNIRIIDVDFHTLLSRNIAYTDLSDIVDTEAHQRGLLQSLFNYGNVGVQTAGVKANFEFTKVPKPNKVVDALSDLMRNRKRHG